MTLQNDLLPGFDIPHLNSAAGAARRQSSAIGAECDAADFTVAEQERADRLASLGVVQDDRAIPISGGGQEPTVGAIGNCNDVAAVSRNRLSFVPGCRV